MNTPVVQVERRVGQRFPYLLPVSIHEPQAELEAVGITQDLSSRGVFFLTEASLKEGSLIELTLRMPSEITLGESMRVRCKGRILRIVPSPRTSASGESKIGVAVRFECYEYLQEPSDAATSSRLFALHPQHEEERRQISRPPE